MMADTLIPPLVRYADSFKEMSEEFWQALEAEVLKARQLNAHRTLHEDRTPEEKTFNLAWALAWFLKREGKDWRNPEIIASEKKAKQERIDRIEVERALCGVAGHKFGEWQEPFGPHRGYSRRQCAGCSHMEENDSGD